MHDKYKTNCRIIMEMKTIIINKWEIIIIITINLKKIIIILHKDFSLIKINKIKIKSQIHFKTNNRFLFLF